MRSFAANFTTALESADGTRFAALVEITEPEGPTTVRLAFEDLTWSTGSVAYTGELLELGNLYDRLDGVGDVRLVALDNATNRAAIVLGAEVVIYLLANVTPAGAEVDGDRELMFKGMVSDPLTMAAGVISFDAVSNDIAKHNRRVGRTLTTTEFAGLDPDEQGKLAPIVVGVMDRHRCAGVDLGSITPLAASVGATGTDNIELSDGSAFPSSGTIQLDFEQIDFTGKTDNTLTGISRGQNGTTGAAHVAGTPAVELQTEYQYLIADHPIKRASAVYVDGVRQVPNVSSPLNGAVTDSATSLTVDDASDFPAKGTVFVNSEEIHYASITTNTLNSLTRGANGTTAAAHADNDTAEAAEWQIEIDDSNDQAMLSFFSPLALARLDTIETSVTDSIDVSDPTHSHTGTTGTMTATVSSVSGLTGVTTPSNINNSTANFAKQEFQDGQANTTGTITMTLSSTTTGRTPTSATLRVRVAQNYPLIPGSIGFGSGYSKWSWGGSSYPETGIDSGDYTTLTLNKSVSSWSEITSLAARIITPGIFQSGNTNDTFRMYTVDFSVINYQTNPSQSSSTGVAKTGTVEVDVTSSTADTVIGNDIRVDVEGAVDDGTGTYTGVAGSLLDHPGPVAHWLTDTFGNLDTAEETASQWNNVGVAELAFSIAEPVGLRDLLSEIGRVARAPVIYSGGGFQLSRRQTDVAEGNVTSPESTIGDSMIVRGDGGESTVSIGYVGLDAMVNRMTYLAKTRGDGREQVAGVIEDTTSQTDYGVRTGDLRLEILSNSSEISSMATWSANRAKTTHRRRVISLRVTLAGLKFEPGDWVRITSTKLDIDTLAEVIAAGPKAISRSSGASVQLLLEEFYGVDPAWF